MSVIGPHMALSALEARLWVLDRLKESYGSVAFTAALGDGDDRISLAVSAEPSKKKTNSTVGCCQGQGQPAEAERHGATRPNLEEDAGTSRPATAPPVNRVD